MKNADKFKAVFGLYATELWAMPEGEFLKWLNSESAETEQLEDRIRNLEEELKEERHANEVLEYLVENRELKNKVEYKDGVIHGLKYSIRYNGVGGDDIGG